MHLKKVIVLLMIAVFMNGCWNRREINTLGFVLGAGIDTGKKGKGYLITVQIAKPEVLKKNNGATQGKAYKVVSGEGETIFEAVRLITREVAKKLFWSHNQFVMVGEDAARSGILKTLDFVERDAELRRTFWIIITKKKAKEILEADITEEKIPAMAFNETLKLGSATSEVANVNLNDFLIMINAKGISPIAPVIALKEKKGKPYYQYIGSAVFRGDKMVGMISGEETRGLLWVKGQVKSGIVVINSGKQNQKAGIEILHSSAKISARKYPYINVDIKMEGNIGDQFGDLKINDPEVITDLEKKLALAIKEEIMKSWHKAIKYKADIMGFGEALHRDNNKEWQAHQSNWNSQLESLKVLIKVEAKIRRTGLILEQIGARAK